VIQPGHGLAEHAKKRLFFDALEKATSYNVRHCYPGGAHCEERSKRSDGKDSPAEQTSSSRGGGTVHVTQVINFANDADATEFEQALK
jgi:hypothetical protein